MEQLPARRNQEAGGLRGAHFDPRRPSWQRRWGSRHGNQRRRVEATRNVVQLMKRGKRALRLLNAILQARLADDPSLLAAWDNVRAVKEVRGGSSGSPTLALVEEAAA